MSVVIIGGHDRMVCQYKQICKQFKCKAKVFTQMSAAMSKQIGSPDLIVLFTNTVSHKMVRCAVEEAGRCNAEVVRCHTSSKNALEEILGTLEAKERRLIYMRYFQNMTQMEIAHELGVSQVQVSRMEKRILRSLQESAEKK